MENDHLSYTTCRNEEMTAFPRPFKSGKALYFGENMEYYSEIYCEKSLENHNNK